LERIKAKDAAYRINNLERIKANYQAAMTPEQRAVRLARMRSRHAAMTPEQRAVRLARQRSKMAQRRLEWAKIHPVQKRVPIKDTPSAKRKNTLDSRVTRAAKAYQKAQTPEAKLKLAIAQVERYTFSQKNGLRNRQIPSAEFFELAAPFIEDEPTRAADRSQDENDADHQSEEEHSDLDADLNRMN
jgi:predicted metal-dependent hydrolase